MGDIWYIKMDKDRQPLMNDGVSDDEDYDFTQSADEPLGEVKDTDVIISSPPVKLCCPYVVELAIFAFSFVGSPMGALIGQYSYALVAQHLGTNYTNLTTNNGPVAGCNSSSFNGTHDYMYERREVVQRNVSQLNIYTSLVSLLPMFIMTSFWGAYSDRMGRKVLMLLPTIAATLACGAYMLIMKLDLSIYTLFAPPIIYDIIGPGDLIIMASFAYIADTCPPETKAFRMALIDISLLVAGAIGSVGTGYFIEAVGFFWPFVFVVCGKLLVFIYTLTFVPQTKPKSIKEKKSILSYFSSTIKVYSKHTKNGRRWKLALLSISYLIIRLGQPDAVSTLFQMNAPLCWGSVMMGYFNAYYTIVVCLGLLFGTKILKRWMSDEWVSAAGLTSGIIGCIYLSMVKTTVMAMFVPLFFVLQLLPTPLIRAIMSNIVEPDEQGAMLAGLMIAARLAGTISNFIVTPIYQATMEVWVGLVFLVSAASYVIALIFMLLFIYLCWKEQQHDRNNQGEDSTEIEDVTAH